MARKRTGKSFVAPGWSRSQAAALDALLAAKARDGGPMGYCEMAGFLFALACAPELVMPSEWIPEVLGENKAAFGSLAEARETMNLVMGLYNHINREVLEGNPALPAGIAVRELAVENFGPEAPLGRWAQGYSSGQMWLEETWDAHVGNNPDAVDEGSLDEVLGTLMMALGFFASRRFAEGCIEEWEKPLPLEAAAARMLEVFPDAMRELAALGRGLEEAARASPRGSPRPG
jgi:yecA family protein